MSGRTTVSAPRNGLEIVEEAVHLLRGTPLRMWSIYFTGALPFGLAVAYFFTDMSHSAFASEQLITSSFLVALAFAWKQSWQAVFASELYERQAGEQTPWSVGRALRMAAMQIGVQPLSLVLLPLAFLTMFPFPFAVGFFRNLTLTAGLGRPKAAALARRHSGLWPGQAWTALSVFSLLALLLLVNYLVTLAIVPQLIKSFFGIESDVTRYSRWILNWTVITAAAVLVYLTLDPLLDAVYVLRCFYGESIATGADLRAVLRKAVSVAALLVCSMVAMSAQAPSPAGPPPPPSIDSARLERAIDETVRRREFTWRSPKTIEEHQESKFEGWVKSVWKAIRRAFQWIGDWIQRVFFPEQTGAETKGSGFGNATVVRWLLIALGAGFVALILYIFNRQRKAASRRIRATPVAAAAVIDLKDESVTADQLPEASWLALAQECIDKGDNRLALRALYLGTISHLSQRGLLAIQRWKSGMDYNRELARKARAIPEILPTFASSVHTFECGWYGRHEVYRQTLDEFAAKLEEMRRSAK